MTPAARTDIALGDAQQLVRRAAIDVINEKGLGSFSIREVARRAGVSHATPGYFFGDTRGLLTSLATEGFETLRRELSIAAASTDDPVERLTAIGRAYVRVAMTYPAHFEVLFRADVIDANNVECETAGLRAFGVLEQTVTQFAEAHNPDLDIESASRLCWSAMQGLVQLGPKIARMDLFTRDEPIPLESTVERFTDLMVSGFLRR